MNAEQIFQRLKDGVIRGDDEEVIKAANDAVAAEIDAFTAINKGLVEGMNVVSDLYEKEEYYVPEVIVSADALYAGLDILKPHLKADNGGEKKGIVVIGVVQGDVHDIGKNLVKLMLEIAGFEVHDLGRDVDINLFADKAAEVNADIICMSSLMTTTMVAIKDILPQIKQKVPDSKSLIGGAPISQKVADAWGADGYGDNATEAVRVARELFF